MKLALSKRCSCRKPDACAHDWYLRSRTPAGRVRVNVTQRCALTLPMKRADVMHHAAKVHHEVRNGLVSAPKRATLTIGDVADYFVKAHPKRPHHYLNGARVISVPPGVKFEEKAIADVTTADIKHLVSEWRKRKHFGPNAERHLLQACRRLFTWAIEEGYATKTPFMRDGVSVIKVKTSDGRSRRLEAGEKERIVKVADPFITDFFTAMIETGCRPGELRGLQWSEVRDDELVVLASKSKTKKERRVPIMPELREILDRRRKGPDGDNLAADRYVFGNAVGDQYTRRHLCRLWEQTCEAAGVKDLHLHDLRAEAGSQLIEAGVPIHEVRDALGHSSTMMTDTYLRTRVNSLKQAYERRRMHLVKKGPRAQGESEAQSA
jgi:integrase